MIPCDSVYEYVGLCTVPCIDKQGCHPQRHFSKGKKTYIAQNVNDHH